MNPTFVYLLSLLLVLMSGEYQSPSSRGQTWGGDTGQPSEISNAGAVQVAMRNVHYHYTPLIAVDIRQLQGELVPTKPGGIVIFDDKNSFIAKLASAEIAIACDDLAHVMNENVFAASDAPIKKISITSKGNRLVIKGQLHQKENISFETTGTLSPNPDGRIRFHTEHVKAAHLPVKGLLDLLGVDLAKLINTNKVEGVSFDKDDLLLNPEKILPPPHIRGKVTAVKLQSDQIVQVFGSAESPGFAARLSGNYMAYRNNDLRFGKLTMSQTDMVLIDMDPADPFDFYLDHYKDQLVAGYSKTTPTFGLRVYMRDYDKLHKATAARHVRN
jgi:hypothetical protein